MVNSCVDTQVKTVSASSLVAAYWRVEEVVDRPVAGSTFKLGVICTAVEDGRDSAGDKHVCTQTQVDNIAHVAKTDGLVASNQFR